MSVVQDDLASFFDIVIFSLLHEFHVILYFTSSPGFLYPLLCAVCFTLFLFTLFTTVFYDLVMFLLPILRLFFLLFCLLFLFMDPVVYGWLELLYLSFCFHLWLALFGCCAVFANNQEVLRFVAYVLSFSNGGFVLFLSLVFASQQVVLHKIAWVHSDMNKSSSRSTTVQ